MALSHSPKIVTDGLVLCLDAGNYKSHLRYSSGWSGTYGSATNSFDGSTSTVSGAVGGTFSAIYTFPTPLITSSSSSTVRIFTDLGASSGQVGSTVNIILINGIDITQKLKNVGAYAGSAQWIDITTEVGGVFKTIQLNGTSGVSNPGIYAVEVGGQVLVDSVTWTDLSGQGNNGTLVNGVGYSGGNLGSLVFDGVDDYVDFSSEPDLNAKSFSVGCWFKTTDTDMRLIQNASTGGFGTKNGFQISVTDTTFANTAVTSNNGSSIQFSDTSSLPYIDGNWHFICLTFNTTTGKAELYLDGSFTSSGTDTGLIGANMNGLGLEIGRANSSQQYLNGNISFAFMYEKVLTASEIQQNFNALRGRYGI